MKKLLVLAPLVILLAAGCNNGTVNGTGDNNQNSSQSTSASDNNMMASSTSPESDNSMPGMDMSASSSMADNGSMSGNSLKGTLQTSDNTSKGNYKIISGNNVIYLHTSQDYSSLVGQSVEVKYSGDMMHFTVDSITSVGGTMMNH